MGTDPVCCNENLQWLGGGFERYGYLKWRFRVSDFWFPVAKPETHLSLPVFNWIAIDVCFVDGCGGFDLVIPRKVILRW